MAVAPEEITEPAPLDPAYSPDLLRYQLRRRGLDWNDLKSEPMSLGANTLTRLRRGRYASPRTMRRLADFLRRHRVDPELDALLERPS